MPTTDSDLAVRLKEIQLMVAQAALRAGRSASDISLLAASKTRSAEEINRAIEAGVALIGENRIQEAQAKLPDVLAVRRHFIGHLQSNKVKLAVALFDCVESVDRPKLAVAIGKEAQKQGKTMPVLIEVNVADEHSKQGVSPENVLAFAKQIAPIEGLSVEGLMAMPPFTRDPEQARPHFARMRELYNALGEVPGVCARHLSMGTSQDFAVAIEEGSTIVRLGTALFGPRAT